ncbi:MAG TPA: hypothetical protein VLT87_08830 [Thermoanaerobaculia bacterium]|nr:hypothetical protein [Thermoanaerobaculia bacterium]
MMKTWIRFAFALTLAAATLGLLGPVPESEAVLKCPPTYCSSLACPSPCVRTLGRCTACAGGDGTPARYFQCINPSTGAQCVPSQYCSDPSCLG